MDAAAPDSVSLGGALVAWQCAAYRGPAAQQVVAKGGLQYRVCADCGTASLDPLPETREAIEIYGDDY